MSDIQATHDRRAGHSVAMFRDSSERRSSFIEVDAKRSTRSRPQVSITQLEWSKAARQTRSGAGRQEANIASRRDYGEAGTGCTAFNVPCSGKRIGNNRGQTCSSARKSHQSPTGLHLQRPFLFLRRQSPPSRIPATHLHTQVLLN